MANKSNQGLPMIRVFVQALALAISVWIAPGFSLEIDTIWTKTYKSIVEARCACETIDGGFIVVGNKKQENSINNDICLLRTNSKGDSLWAKTFGTDEHDMGYAVVTMSDGGYLVVGRTGALPSTWVIRTNSAGDSIWTRQLPNSSLPRMLVTQSNPCSNILEEIGNDTYGIATNSGLVIMDASGNYRFLTSSACDVVSRTSDSGFILAENSSLSRIHSQGTKLWGKNVGYGFKDELIKSVRETKDHGFFVLLNTDYNREWGTMCILKKIAANGDSVWTGPMDLEPKDEGLDLHVLSDGGMLVTGKTGRTNPYYGLWFIRFDANGGSRWMPLTNYPVTKGIGWSIRPTHDDGYIVAGDKGGACLMKFMNKTSAAVRSETPVQPNRAAVIAIDRNHRYTIPFSLKSDAAVSLRIFDIQGKIVSTVKNLTIANGEVVCFPENNAIPSGKYWYKLSSGKNEWSGSFLCAK
jgi:hypothetical protein